jgi:glycosyltransferase involved in cell wall biosynthesis
LRIVLFSSQFFNVVNYLRILADSDDELTWTPLVSTHAKEVFEERLGTIRGLTEMKIRLVPILLASPNKSLKNLLNPQIVLRDFYEIFRTLRKLKPDVIIVSYLLDAYPVAILKHLLGCTFFVIATGGDINLNQGLGHMLLRRVIYSQADMVFAVSNQLQSKILLEGHRLAVLLPTGVDTSFFHKLEDRRLLRRKWHFSDGEIVVLIVSNLEPHKGVDVAIRAVGLLHDTEIESLRLVVVGRGPQKPALEKLVKSLKLEKSVLFLGELAREDLLELYNASNVFVLSSRSEGLPFSLLEAMACESICIASSVGDIPVVLKDGVNGFLVRSVHPIDVASAIRRALVMNEVELSKIGREARRTVSESYDLVEITKKMTKIIHA